MGSARMAYLQNNEASNAEGGFQNRRARQDALRRSAEVLRCGKTPLRKRSRRKVAARNGPEKTPGQRTR